MAHHQKAVAAAGTFNSAIFVVEAIAGYQADSLSLIMDSIHNLSDELALIFTIWPLCFRRVSHDICCVPPTYQKLSFLLLSPLSRTGWKLE
jgi:Co/Zn/Cd efflux system component